jgi:hypothetical protein
VNDGERRAAAGHSTSEGSREEKENHNPWPYLGKHGYACPQTQTQHLSSSHFYPMASNMPLLCDPWSDNKWLAVPRRGSCFDVRAYLRDETRALTSRLSPLDPHLTCSKISDFACCLLEDSKLALHANRCTEFSLFHTHGLHVVLDQLIKGMQWSGRRQMEAWSSTAVRSIEKSRIAYETLVDNDVLNGNAFNAFSGPSHSEDMVTMSVGRRSPASEYLQYAADNLRVAGERILGGGGAEEEMEAVVSVAASAFEGQGEIFDKTAALVTETGRRIFGGAGKEAEMEEELGLSTPSDNGIE